MAVTVLAWTEKRGAVVEPRWKYASLALAVSLLSLLLPWGFAQGRQWIDQHCYNALWATSSTEIRSLPGMPPRLPAAAASRTSNPSLAALTAPVDHKIGGDLFLYRIEYWGRTLTEEGKHWTGGTAAFPQAYEQYFPHRAEVALVALRLYGHPMHCGLNTPKEFKLESYNNTRNEYETLYSYPGTPCRTVMQGMFFCMEIPVSPPRICDGMKISISSTEGGGPAMMADFACFGQDLANASKEECLWLGGLKPLEVEGLVSTDHAIDANQALLAGDWYYEKGLITRAPSKVVYQLNGKAQRLRAVAAMVPAAATQTCVIKVLADGQERFSTTLLSGATNEVPVVIEGLSGVTALELRSESAQTSPALAVWANARVEIEP